MVSIFVQNINAANAHYETRKYPKLTPLLHSCPPTYREHHLSSVLELQNVDEALDSNIQ